MNRFVLLIILVYMNATSMAQYNTGFGGGFYVVNSNYSFSSSIYKVGIGGGFSYSDSGIDGNYLPLPIRLINYSALCENDDVIISWIVAEEEDVYYYSIEMSVDFIEWSLVKMVFPDKLNLNSYKYYSEIIENSSGLYYYRIKYWDYNGKGTFLKVAGLNCNKKVTFFPNPAKDYIHISGLNSDFNYRVVNLLGNVITEKHCIHDFYIIDLSGLKTGIYLLEVISDGSIFKEIIAVYGNE